MDSSIDVNAVNQEAQLTIQGELNNFACLSKLLEYCRKHNIRVDF